MAIRVGRFRISLRSPLRESQVVPGRGVLGLQPDGGAEMRDRLLGLAAAEEDLADFVVGDLFLRVRLDRQTERAERLVLATGGDGLKSFLAQLRSTRARRRSVLRPRLAGGERGSG